MKFIKKLNKKGQLMASVCEKPKKISLEVSELDTRLNFWGMLTTMELYDCKPELMTDTKKMKEYVIRFCKLIDMKRWGKCHIARLGKDYLEGYSVFQFIETSSITIHFDEQLNQVFIDLFSCKGYDPVKAFEFSKNFFGAKRADMLIRKRGFVKE